MYIAAFLRRNYVKNLFSVIKEAFNEIGIFIVKLWLSTRFLINNIIYSIKVFFCGFIIIYIYL